MFEKKLYIKKKIKERLLKNPANNLGLDTANLNWNAINELLDKIDNVDLVPTHGENFETSTIGWVSFCNAVEKMIAQNLELNNVDNLQLCLESSSNSVAKPRTTTRGSEKIDDSLLVEEDLATKLQRLLEISETEQIAEDMDYEFLTLQGLKVIGAVDGKESVLSAEEIEIDRENFLPVVRFDPQTENLTSPYTGTSELYRVSHNVWTDLTNGKSFRVVYAQSSV